MREACVAYLEACSLNERAKLLRRFQAVSLVWGLEAFGHTRSAAVCVSARHHGVSPKSVWRWLKRIDGCSHDPVIQMRFLARDGVRVKARIKRLREVMTQLGEILDAR